MEHESINGESHETSFTSHDTSSLNGIAVTSKATAVMLVSHLNNERIEDALDLFAQSFKFQDHGIGLQFSDQDRLSEFFRKSRELYPDSALETHMVFANGDDVVMEWTMYATVSEPFYGGLLRRVPVSVQGVSVVRVVNGKITEWTDYYNGVSSRRAALAAHFEEWVEF